MSALDRAYQNMTDAQAMSFEPPAASRATLPDDPDTAPVFAHNEALWDDTSTEDTERTVDMSGDEEETVDWAPSEHKPRGEGR